MAWNPSKIVILKSAKKNLDKLDKPTAQRLLVFLFERVARLDNPRELGEALRGKDLGAFWKYRCGDYRLIAKIDDDQIVIHVVRIGHRREVYD